jgi:hypothetical protein
MATQAELDAARAALHDLMMGNGLRRYRKTVEGWSLRRPQSAILKKYIADLESQVGTTSRRRGPARFYA